MKPVGIKKQVKERRAERATLTYTHLLKGLSSCASYLHGEHPTTAQRSDGLDGRQHPGPHPNGLQLVPQKMVDTVMYRSVGGPKSRHAEGAWTAVPTMWRKAMR